VLLAIKEEVDKTSISGHFLLTGSANLLLMKKVSESPAGRAIYFHLPPLTWAEMEQRTFGNTLDVVLNNNSIESIVNALPEKHHPPDRPLSSAIFRGGYPLPALSGDLSYQTRRFDGYVQTYLERDLRDLSSTDNLVEFRRLMHICATQNGRLLNIASIAYDAVLPPATARRYLMILEVSFQICRIPAFTVNRGKRVIKSPKIYWTDTGLAAHMAGIYSEDSYRINCCFLIFCISVRHFL
jgi:hypothetical protein